LAIPARTNHARITRLLPPDQRTVPGVDRVVVDVDLAAVLAGKAPAPTLHAGDDVRIFRVHSEVRDLVSISGAVWNQCQTAPPGQDSLSAAAAAQRAGRALADTVGADSAKIGSNPGTLPPQRETSQPTFGLPTSSTGCAFRLRPGMHVWDLIDQAGGLRPDAYLARAQIIRLDPSDSTLSMIPFSLERGAQGQPVDNPPLREFDVVRVFPRTDFRDSLTVTIAGEVRRPGRRVYAEGMTLGDLILQAGGLTPEADLTVELARRPYNRDRTENQLADIMQVRVDSSYIVSGLGMQLYPGDPFGPRGGTREPAADTLRLRPDDRVFVRRVPAFEPQRTVLLEGEVRYPGSYALRSKGDRVSMVIERAGGLTGTAYAAGFQLYRDGILVNVDLPAALRHPRGPDDPILFPDDSMMVPEYNPVVIVQGAVNAPASVLYRKGAGLQYYIDNAGGYAPDANKGAVHIRYANGGGAVRRTVLFFHTSPEPGPGSVVTVPTMPANRRTNVANVITNIAQVSSALTTLLILITKF
ncbi:MAG TPA: SLBB domain-containing protein, partial [Longimicrobiales bacterium]|nr:SLBB domain-containing protein [Longimicrobiales bacterium]